MGVIAIPDENWRERPLVLVVLKEDSLGSVTEQHIKLHVKEWTGPDVQFVNSLEKTSIGKLDKKVMRQKHG